MAKTSIVNGKAKCIDHFLFESNHQKIQIRKARVYLKILIHNFLSDNQIIFENKASFNKVFWDCFPTKFSKTTLYKFAITLSKRAIC
jgi:hypothetical protein